MQGDVYKWEITSCRAILAQPHQLHLSQPFLSMIGVSFQVPVWKVTKCQSYPVLQLKQGVYKVLSAALCSQHIKSTFINAVQRDKQYPFKPKMQGQLTVLRPADKDKVDINKSTRMTRGQVAK